MSTSTLTSLDVKSLPKSNYVEFINDILSRNECKSKHHSHVRSFQLSLSQQVLNEQQKKKLQEFSSVDYLPDHSLSYIQWIGQHKSRLYSHVQWDRWFLVFLIGVCTGLVAVLLKQTTQALGTIQWSVTKSYLQNGELAKGFGYQAGTNCIYVAIGAILVTFVSPLAMGGGTPEVIAFLNGIMVHGMFTMKNLIVKFAANVLTVSSGLPATTQAPIITYGAIIGAGVGQFQSRTLRFAPNVFKRFRNPEDRRAFMTDGVAAGVAAGFNSPIGGILFAMEDLSSFWSKGLSWETFFCAVVATAVAQMLNTAFVSFEYQGSFGGFNIELVEPLQMHVVILLPAIVLGALGGLLGAFFTRFNVFINDCRKKLYTKPKQLWLQKTLRIIETLFIVLVMTSFTVFMPLGFSCRQKNVLSNYTTFSNCYFASAGSPKEIQLDAISCPQPEPNGTQIYYNDVSTLIQGVGTAYLSKLWSRGTYFLFDWSTCVSVFVVYFFMTLWTLGSAVSGGIFVSLLICGSLMGRSLGVGMLYIWQTVADTPYPLGEWKCLDPGVIAAIGSAALLSGVNRLEVASTVIVMEMVGDINLVIPILISIFISKMIADQLSKPLYKFQLEGKALPFLDQEPRIVIKKRYLNMDLFKISDVMSSPIVSIHIQESISRLATTLLETNHSGFPVVKYDPDIQKDVFYGLITRSVLCAILCSDFVYNKEYPESIINPEISYEELCADYLTDASLTENRLKTYVDARKYANVYVNLAEFINISTPAVEKHFSLLRCYRIFRTLGLHHLVVIDTHNCVAGMITRQNLMSFHIQEKLEEVLDGNTVDPISSQCTSVDETDEVFHAYQNTATFTLGGDKDSNDYDDYNADQCNNNNNDRRTDSWSSVRTRM